MKGVASSHSEAASVFPVGSPEGSAVAVRLARLTTVTADADATSAELEVAAACRCISLRFSKLLSL